jgi:hypothetical protein
MTEENKKNNLLKFCNFLKQIIKLIWNCEFLLTVIIILIIVRLIFITSNYYEKTYIVNLNGEYFKNMYDIAFNNLTNWLTGLGILLTVVTFIFGFITYDYSDKIDKRVDEKYEKFSREIKDLKNENLKNYINLSKQDNKEQIEIKIKNINLLIQQEGENQFNLSKIAYMYYKLAVVNINFKDEFKINIEKSEEIHKKLIDENIASGENLNIIRKILLKNYHSKYNIFGNINEVKLGIEYGYELKRILEKKEDEIFINNSICGFLNILYLKLNDNFEKISIKDKEFSNKNDLLKELEELNQDSLKLESNQTDGYFYKSCISYYQSIRDNNIDKTIKLKEAIFYFKKVISKAEAKKQLINGYYGQLRLFYEEISKLENDEKLKIQYIEEAIFYLSLEAEDFSEVEFNKLSNDFNQYYTEIVRSIPKIDMRKEYLEKEKVKYLKKYNHTNKKYYLSAYNSIIGYIVGLNINYNENIVEQYKKIIEDYLKDVANDKDTIWNYDWDKVYEYKLDILLNFLVMIVINNYLNFNDTDKMELKNFLINKMEDIYRQAIGFNPYNWKFDYCRVFFYYNLKIQDLDNDIDIMVLLNECYVKVDKYLEDGSEKARYKTELERMRNELSKKGKK